MEIRIRFSFSDRTVISYHYYSVFVCEYAVLYSTERSLPDGPDIASIGTDSFSGNVGLGCSSSGWYNVTGRSSHMVLMPLP